MFRKILDIVCVTLTQMTICLTQVVEIARGHSFGNFFAFQQQDHAIPWVFLDFCFN
ncbi:MAG: hypothetical protein NZM38_05505 [Cytophagales bacterium]|nr:hypothetical protein [Cytophagales bacterium]MDW8384210.1 hypothetical protein [Flammeovirgaceae bacterium]